MQASGEPLMIPKHLLVPTRRQATVVDPGDFLGVGIVLGGDDPADTSKWVYCSYADSYSPVLNDTVITLSHDGDHFVVGRPSWVGHVWAGLSYATNVTDYGSPWGTGQWVKLGGIVYFRGLVKTTAIIAATGALWTMPVGARLALNGGLAASRFESALDATGTPALVYQDGSGVMRTLQQLASGASFSVGGWCYPADS